MKYLFIIFLFISCAYFKQDQAKDWKRSAETWRDIANDCIEYAEDQSIYLDSLRLELNRRSGVLPQNEWNELKKSNEAECQKD